MRLSRIAMLPFAITGGYILYQMMYNYKYEWSYYLVLPVVAIAACLALYPQLDAIGYKWWPPKADPMIRNILERSSPSLIWIKEEDREAFYIRCLDAIRNVDYMGMKVDDIPTDVKVMCIYPALLIEYIVGIKLLKHYNRVILYKHPFPSPEIQEWHAAEIHHEDGVVLFSLEQLIPNFSRSGAFYHVGFDAWIRALMAMRPELEGRSKMSTPVDYDQNDLELTSARKYLGLESVTSELINWSALLQYPELFRERTGLIPEEVLSEIRS